MSKCERSPSGHVIVPLADVLERLRDIGNPDADGVTVIDLLLAMARLGCERADTMYLREIAGAM